MATKFGESGGKPGYCKLERETGIEPATCSLGSYRSTTELLPLKGRQGPS